MSVIDFSLELLGGWLKSNKAILRRKVSRPTTADARKLRRSKLKDNLTFAAFSYGIVGAGNIVLTKLFFSHQRLQLVPLRELCCPMKNLPVIRTPDSCQQRQQSEHPGVCGRTKRQWRKRVRPPAKTTDDMTRVAFDGCERGIRHRAAKGVIDDVEACAVGVLSNIVVDRRMPVDCDRAYCLDNRSLIV